MLSFAGLAEIDAKWKTFAKDPGMDQALHHAAFAFDQLVVNIGDLILSPLACSQL